MLYAVWLIFTALFAFYILKRPQDFVINGPLIFGWLLFALQLTWIHSEKFYLWIKKYWLFIKNPVCYWDMDVEMKGNVHRNLFPELDKIFRSQKKPLNRIEKRSNTRRKYELADFNIEVSIDETNGIVNFHIQNLRVPFRYSRSVIENQICSLFEKLQLKIKPDADQCQYGLIIEFQETNPYYGFFVRRLNKSDIQNFNVVFKVDDDSVRVSKSTIQINASTINSLNTITKNYLTLSPR